MFTISESAAAQEGVQEMEMQPGFTKRKLEEEVSPSQDIRKFSDPDSPAGPDRGSDTSGLSYLGSGQ